MIKQFGVKEGAVCPFWGGSLVFFLEHLQIMVMVFTRFFELKLGFSWKPTHNELFYSNRRKNWCLLRINLYLRVTGVFEIDIHPPIFVLPQDSRSEIEKVAEISAQEKITKITELIENVQ